MNNRGEAEGLLMLAIFFIIIFTLLMKYQMSWNSDVKSEKRFLIGESVYECKLMQKLEYEGSK
jgi:hypothetical protein